MVGLSEIFQWKQLLTADAAENKAAERDVHELQNQNNELKEEL